jgi:hypothetical protein
MAGGDHFTQQPVGVGADPARRSSREARGAGDNSHVSADSDGNQQPLGGDADADERGNPQTPRPHVAEGGSGQGAGSALHDLYDIEHAIWRGANRDEPAPDHWPDWLIGAALAVDDLLTQHPSGGQEGGVEEGADECPNSPDGAHDFEDHGGGVVKCKVCGAPK